MVAYDWEYVGSIWDAYFAGDLSMKKRDEALERERKKLRSGKEPRWEEGGS